MHKENIFETRVNKTKDYGVLFGLHGRGGACAGRFGVEDCHVRRVLHERSKLHLKRTPNREHREHKKSTKREREREHFDKSSK